MLSGADMAGTLVHEALSAIDPQGLSASNILAEIVAHVEHEAGLPTMISRVPEGSALEIEGV